MAGRGWLWVEGAKLWLVVGDRGWWWQNYGWSLVVVGGGNKVMVDLVWS